MCEADGSCRWSAGYLRRIACSILVAAFLGAQPGAAQLRDLFDDLLGRSREIVSVEEIEGDETRAKFRVTYREVEDPEEVELSMRPLDQSARSVAGFESESVRLTASEGEAVVGVAFTGAGEIRLEGVEVRLERRGRTFARKFVAMRRVWGVPGSSGTGGSSVGDDGSGGAAGALVTLNPTPLGDTPSVGSGGSGSGGSGGSSQPPSLPPAREELPRHGGINPPGLADRHAYVWADQPSAANYTPNATYTHNTGGPVNIRRIGPGRYQVTLGGFSREDRLHAQVTAYGGGSEKCNTGGFLPSGQSTSLMVYCFSASGQPADSRFTALVLLQRRTGNGRAYAVADNPTSASYTPAQAAGASVAITRASTGIYRIQFTGMAQPGTAGNAQVSARESRATDCALQSLQSDPSRNLIAVVQCFDASGARVDSRFEILATANPQGLGNVGFLASEYDRVRSPQYLFNSTNQGGTVTRSGTGAYSVSFAGVGSGTGKGGTVQITALGGTNNYCKVVNWNYSAFSASIACFNRAGQKADSNFSALVVR